MQEECEAAIRVARAYGVQQEHAAKFGSHSESRLGRRGAEPQSQSAWSTHQQVLDRVQSAARVREGRRLR
eukprot:2179795-Pleurochrysis_carterae.AAC.1